MWSQCAESFTSLARFLSCGGVTYTGTALVAPRVSAEAGKLECLSIVLLSCTSVFLEGMYVRLLRWKRVVRTATTLLVPRILRSLLVHVPAVHAHDVLAAPRLLWIVMASHGTC